MTDVQEFGSTELISQSIIDELAAAAANNKVMISITVTPFDANEDT